MPIDITGSFTPSAGANAFKIYDFIDIDVGTPVSKTLASDAFTQTTVYHVLQPQTGTADDLATITPIAAPSARSIILLRCEDAADTITIKHNVGNILVSGGSDFVLSGQDDFALGFYDGVLSKWVMIGGSVGGAGGTLNDAYDFGGVGAGRVITVDSGLPVTLEGVTDYGLLWFQQSGDAAPRLSIYRDGKLEWGSGSGAADVVLQRAAANVLALAADDTLRLKNIDTAAGDLLVRPATGVIDLIHDGGAASMRVTRYQDGTAGAWFEGLHARGTEALPTAVLSGDDLVVIEASGHHGGAFVTGGQLVFEAAENWAGAAWGTQMRLLLVPIGTFSNGTQIIWSVAGGVITVAHERATILSTVAGDLTLDPAGNIDVLANTLRVASLDTAAGDQITRPATGIFSVIRDGGAAGSYVTRYQDSVSGAQFVGRHARGSEATPTVLLSGDDILVVEAVGYRTGAFATGGQLVFEASENWGAVWGTQMKLRMVATGGFSLADQIIWSVASDILTVAYQRETILSTVAGDLRLSPFVDIDADGNAIENVLYQDFDEGAAPGTPPAGHVRLYAKTDGSIASKDDAGAETVHGAGGGSGDVVGPASATDMAVALYDGVTGRLIKNSVVVCDASGNITGVLSITGPAGGSTITGGTGPGDDLILIPTSHATKGDLLVDDVDIFKVVHEASGSAKFQVQRAGLAQPSFTMQAGATAGVMKFGSGAIAPDAGIQHNGAGKLRADVTELLVYPGIGAGLALDYVVGGAGTLRLTPHAAQTADRAISFPDASGEVALDSELHAEAHAASHAENAADELDAASLGSGASTDGQVLTSDGLGGAAWEAAGGGGGSSAVAATLVVPGYMPSVAANDLSLHVPNPGGAITLTNYEARGRLTDNGSMTLRITNMAELDGAWLDSDGDGQVNTDNTTEAGLQIGTAFNLLEDSTDYFCFGYVSAFVGLQFDLSTLGSYGTPTWEYWNGAAWASLTVTDGTSNFSVDGQVTWTPPGDWAAVALTKDAGGSTASLFWVRVKMGTVTTVATVYEIKTLVWRESFTIAADAQYAAAALGSNRAWVQSEYLTLDITTINNSAAMGWVVVAKGTWD